jgi:molecular chaperone GrpE
MTEKMNQSTPDPRQEDALAKMKAEVMAKRAPEAEEKPTADESIPADHQLPSYTDLTKELAEMEKQLEEYKTKADENWKKYVQGLADAENIKRRLEGDIERARKFGIEKFAQELLPVADTLECAVQAVSEQLASTHTQSEQVHAILQAIHSGVALTTKMLNDVLSKFGIVMINPVGVTFNPAHHEALSMVEDPSQPAGTVLTVVQKGYLLNDRLVRPARVIVNRS